MEVGRRRSRSSSRLFEYLKRASECSALQQSDLEFSGRLESLGSTMQSARVELLPYLRTLHPSDSGSREPPAIPLPRSNILVAGPAPAALRAIAEARL